MHVAMHVRLPKRHAVRVQRDVREHQFPVELPRPVDFFEIRQVALHRMVVMVPAQQSLVTVAASHRRNVFLLHCYVAEVIDLIPRLDDLVPLLHHELIHLFDRSERAHRLAIYNKLEDGRRMTKVGIRNSEDVTHRYMLSPNTENTA